MKCKCPACRDYQFHDRIIDGVVILLGIASLWFVVYIGLICFGVW